MDFELHHGGPASVKAARAIFQKAHSKCSEIAAKWRAFEGEYGSAESAAQAYRKTSLINFSLMAAEAPRQVEAEVPKPTKRKKPATKKEIEKKRAKKRAKVARSKPPSKVKAPQRGSAGKSGMLVPRQARPGQARKRKVVV